MDVQKKEKTVGTWYALAAYVTWGVLPLYWKALKHVPAREILAHRILWSFVFLVFFIVLRKRWPELKRSYAHKRNRLSSLLSALIIGAVWFIFIWAINANFVVEASMGYYINPLISVLLGMMFLKERLAFWEKIAFSLAILGVAYMTVQYGRFPWIAISLAVLFGLYGLLRKISHVGSLIGLTAETAVLSPFAISYLIILVCQGQSAMVGASPTTYLLFLGAGVVTAVPLVWFARGARRIPLSMIGFFQYLAPTISLILGIFVFKEPFTTTHLISFGLIWIALVIFTSSRTRLMQRVQPRAFP
jgi:chloramphenicol-sensitive protein RarD